MAASSSPAELRTSLNRYRIRILGLNRKILYKVLEVLSISPQSTDPTDLEDLEEEEWQMGAPEDASYSLPPTVRTPNDVIPLLSNGTSPPLAETTRDELFSKIEAALNAQAAPEFRPLCLPDDFKQLCALTNSMEGPGLPRSHMEVPECLSSLHSCLFSLQGRGPYEPLTVEYLIMEA